MFHGVVPTTSFLVILQFGFKAYDQYTTPPKHADPTDPKYNRYIVCLPSIARFQQELIMQEQQDLGGWSLILDELGQMRLMAASEMFSPADMRLVEDVLTHLVAAAPQVVMLQYRLLKEDVEYILTRVNLDIPLSVSEDKLDQFMVKDNLMWANRTLYYTHHDCKLMAAVVEMVLSGIQMDSHNLQHKHPILLMSNYRAVVENMVVLIRKVVAEKLYKWGVDNNRGPGWKEEVDLIVQTRIRLITGELTGTMLHTHASICMVCRLLNPGPPCRAMLQWTMDSTSDIPCIGTCIYT